MEIKVDLDKVVDIEYNIEPDDIWSISFSFENGDACTYGYTDVKPFIKDCTEIANRWRRRWVD